MRAAPPLISGFYLAAIVLVSLGGPASAAEGAGGMVRQACAADVHHLCQGIEPGGGRIIGCMRRNKASLSQNCKNAVAAHQPHRQRAEALPAHQWVDLQFFTGGQ